MRPQYSHHDFDAAATAGRDVEISVGAVRLTGTLTLPGQAAAGLVLFAHGSGSSRFSPRNRFVAEALHAEGLGTLLIDLLTPSEESLEAHTRHLRFDIALLADRLTHVIDWTIAIPDLPPFGLGLFGASTGAAAAIVAAVHRPERVRAVVSRGGRPDLAGSALARLAAPALFVVGGDDVEVRRLNEEARAQMRVPSTMVIVPRATHLFEEPGAIDEVAQLAAFWFRRHLVARPR
jgi:pimeloyl-ACP methyl ester carboxylesterase